MLSKVKMPKMVADVGRGSLAQVRLYLFLLTSVVYVGAQTCLCNIGSTIVEVNSRFRV